MPPFLFLALLALLILGPVAQALASPADRLAEAVRLRTISYQDSERVDYSQFERLHELLQAIDRLAFICGVKNCDHSNPPFFCAA